MPNAPRPQPETLIAPSSMKPVFWRKFPLWLHPQRWVAAVRRPLEPSLIGHGLLLACALGGAIVTANQSLHVQLSERQAQSQFFRLRGAVPAPDNIIILKMDEVSIQSAKAFYGDNPAQYAYLEPLTTLPWKRSAYATAIDRLMAAGAKSIAIDLVFDTPSSYGPQDDQRFIQTLKRYAGRITLAAQFPSDNTLPAGQLTQLIQPHPMFQTNPSSIGSISYPLEPNNRIHRLASEYPQILADAISRTSSPEVAQAAYQFASQTPSFAEAALIAAQYGSRKPTGSDIYFYGGNGESFPAVSFWEVLDPEAWSQRQTLFKDKIVIIGPTADLFQDFHDTPIANKMPGVELNAHAIATLMQGTAISDAIPHLPSKGIVVFFLVMAAGCAQTRTTRPMRRFAAALALVLGWSIIGYALFTQLRLIVPVAVPIIAISGSGVAYLFTGILIDKFKLRRAAREYVNVPVFQEMISAIGHSDLEPVIQQYNKTLIDKKLNNRYLVTSRLAEGGFGETYLAKDTGRPGNPDCVVKRLRPRSNDPRVIRLAQNMFPLEAETLERLGTHDQIPRLLAYFEEHGDFYLVQEFVVGNSLAKELDLGNLLGRLPEQRVVAILYDLLHILEFIHQQGVLHRDIKPGNILLRRSDGKPVLIDFGAVKQFNQRLEILSDNPDNPDAATQLTIAIGTEGFMAPEQADGRPSPASDIYSAGIVGIQALTGLSSSELKQRRNPRTNELNWQENTQISQTLAAILNKMAHYNMVARYQSARDVINDLEPLHDYRQSQTLMTGNSIIDPLEDPDLTMADETQLWPNAFADASAQTTAPSTTELPSDRSYCSNDHDLDPTDLQPDLDGATTEETLYRDETEPPAGHS
jgi:serine/threonine protein kinase/CHASE2 domain-containing sensor protein